MPWQLSGNGRSDWSTKLIRGLKAEAAAGFQSRRERCREPTPVTPQYAAFPTYKAARVHYIYRRCDGVAFINLFLEQRVKRRRKTVERNRDGDGVSAGIREY